MKKKIKITAWTSLLAIAAPLVAVVSCSTNSKTSYENATIEPSKRDVVARDKNYQTVDFSYGRNNMWKLHRISANTWQTGLFSVVDKDGSLSKRSDADAFVQDLVNFFKYKVFHNQSIVDFDGIEITNSLLENKDPNGGVMGEYVRTDKMGQRKFQLFWNQLTDNGKVENPTLDLIEYVFSHEYGHHTTMAASLPNWDFLPSDYEKYQVGQSSDRSPARYAATQYGQNAKTLLTQSRAIFQASRLTGDAENANTFQLIADKTWQDEKGVNWSLPLLTLKTLEQDYRRFVGSSEPLNSIRETRLFNELDNAQQMKDRLPSNYWAFEDGMGHMQMKEAPDTSSDPSTGLVTRPDESFSRYHFSPAEFMTRYMQSLTLSVEQPQGILSTGYLNPFGSDQLMQMVYNYQPWNKNDQGYGSDRFPQNPQDAYYASHPEALASYSENDIWKNYFKGISEYGNDLNTVIVKNNNIYLSGWTDKNKQLDGILLEDAQGTRKVASAVSYDIANTWTNKSFNSDVSERETWEKQEWVSAPIPLLTADTDLITKEIDGVPHYHYGDSRMGSDSLLFESGFKANTGVNLSTSVNKDNANWMFYWDDNGKTAPHIDQEVHEKVNLKREYDTNRWADFKIYGWVDKNNDQKVDDDEKIPFTNDQKVSTYREHAPLFMKNDPTKALNNDSSGSLDKFYHALAGINKSSWNDYGTASLHIFDSLYSRQSRSETEDYFENFDATKSLPANLRDKIPYPHTNERDATSGNEITHIPNVIVPNGMLEQAVKYPMQWYELYDGYKAYLSAYDQAKQAGSTLPNPTDLNPKTNAPYIDFSAEPKMNVDAAVAITIASKSFPADYKWNLTEDQIYGTTY